jgi:hypothetical protein
VLVRDCSALYERSSSDNCITNNDGHNDHNDHHHNDDDDDQFGWCCVAVAGDLVGRCEHVSTANQQAATDTYIATAATAIARLGGEYVDAEQQQQQRDTSRALSCVRSRLMLCRAGARTTLDLSSADAVRCAAGARI